jgi:hypothetical protein
MVVELQNENCKFVYLQYEDLPNIHGWQTDAVKIINLTTKRM